MDIMIKDESLWLRSVILRIRATQTEKTDIGLAVKSRNQTKPWPGLYSLNMAAQTLSFNVLTYIFKLLYRRSKK